MARRSNDEREDQTGIYCVTAPVPGLFNSEHKRAREAEHLLAAFHVPKQGGEEYIGHVSGLRAVPGERLEDILALYCVQAYSGTGTTRLFLDTERLHKQLVISNINRIKNPGIGQMRSYGYNKYGWPHS